VPRVAILFDNFGPYHLARLKAASHVCDVLAVEFGSSSAEYEWKASESGGLKRVALNDRGSSHDLPIEEFKGRLFNVLDEYKPEVVVVPGWGYRGALMALGWGLIHRIPVICMSESTQWDEARNPLKEWIKRRIIGLFSSALVGGTPHRDYMEELGMPSDRIFLGYDAVDNRFFSEEARKIGVKRWEMGGEKQPCFLASARFIEKKNLFRLLKAYAIYRGKALLRRDSVASAFSLQPSVFDLVLLGDGQLRPDLEKLRSELGLEDCVQMPGFKQYEELPEYYAAAGAFIHASTTEQWGLVVNEAMASGLPVLVSNRCGCARDLVRDGENGWTFDPSDEEQMADLMLRISSDEKRRKEMSARSQEIITEWGPERFASGVKAAVEAALSAPKKTAGLLDRFILKVLTSKG
jgi:glycosyltransferase involved in cell wall biosynthesis